MILKRLTFHSVLTANGISLPPPSHQVLDEWGQSITMDFIGPLIEDLGFNCILSIMDRLGADIRIIPTHTDISMDNLTVLFFDNWYCENGLPLNIVSDCDKLFISRFWKLVMALCGVKLKMSMAYHPETDGSSKCTNKMINQCLHFHIDHQQKGWVHALPRIHFAIMNSVNASTGFSNFQLHIGHTPWVIPPIIPSDLPPTLHSASSCVDKIILLQFTGTPFFSHTYSTLTHISHTYDSPLPHLLHSDSYLSCL